MNAFADSLLSVLLSWVKGAAKGIFDFFTSDSSGNFYTWLGDHWLILAALLCVGGVIADYTVWILRYRPFARTGSRKRKKKDRRFDRELFISGYEDRVEVPDAEPSVVPKREEPAHFVREFPPEIAMQEEIEAPFAPDFAVTEIRDRQDHAGEDPGDLLPDGTVRRRRTDRYRDERRNEERLPVNGVIGKIRRTLDGDRDAVEEILSGAADPDEKYYEPVYPQGDASEWQKWNKDPS